MKFTSVLSILLLFDLVRSLPLPKSRGTGDIGHGKLSDSQKQILLYRLDHAEGEAHQLSFFRMLLASQNFVGSCKEQGKCIEQMVDIIERVVLWYAIRFEAGSPTKLRQAKYYTDQLVTVERDYQMRLSLLPKPFKYWYAHSMNESIFGFLGYQLRKLQKLQLELLLGEDFDKVWTKVGESTAQCFAALKSGIKTFQIIGFNCDADQGAINKLVSLFRFKYNSQVVKSLFKNDLGAEKRNESPPRDITTDMNYLREGLSLTIKAGMFLLLCLQYQVYLCSVAFGFMISMSCLIWISVYLEMVSNTV